jgi:hypothetical protein
MVGFAPGEESAGTVAVAVGVAVVPAVPADGWVSEGNVPVGEGGAAAAVVPTAGCGVPVTTTGATATAGSGFVAA